MLGEFDSPPFLLDQLPIVIALQGGDSLADSGLRDAQLGTGFHHGTRTCQRQQSFQIFNHAFIPGPGSSWLDGPLT